MARQTLEFDELYKGLTRPPMLLGVTEVYIVIMMVVEVTLFVGVGGGRGLVVTLVSAPILYLFGYAMCLRDPRIFEIWITRLSRFSVGRRRASYWNGTSFDAW